MKGKGRMITAIVISAILGIAGGGIAVDQLHRRGDRRAQRRDELKADVDIVQAQSAAVQAASNGPGDAVEAAQGPALADAQTRQAVATGPAAEIAVRAAVQPNATRSTIALAGYAICAQAAQAKSEGSAAFGCTARGESLDAALRAIEACPDHPAEEAAMSNQ